LERLFYGITEAFFAFVNIEHPITKIFPIDSDSCHRPQVGFFFVLARCEVWKQETPSERHAPGEKTCRFEPFGVQNARNRSHIAFVHSYATP
ncbi:hypothetical protein U9206_24845, partial [Escherichia coli]